MMMHCTRQSFAPFLPLSTPQNGRVSFNVLCACVFVIVCVCVCACIVVRLYVAGMRSRGVEALDLSCQRRG